MQAIQYLDVSVGARLRALRTERAWTQADLSHFSRMSTGDLSRIETGRLKPTTAQLLRLDRVFEGQLLGA